MFEILSLFVAIIIIIALIQATKKSDHEKNIKEDRYQYQKKDKLFTRTELQFYHELKKHINDEYAIFGQVRLEDVITVEKGLERKKAYGLRSRIKSRHVDYVICKSNDSKIIAAIELDDKSHNNKKAKKTDEFKDKAFKDAGLPLIRFKVEESYKDEITNKLQKYKVLKDVCPKCQGEMNKRKDKKGRMLFVCLNYPKCKGFKPA